MSHTTPEFIRLSIQIPRPPGGEESGRLYIVREGTGVRIWTEGSGEPLSAQFLDEDGREKFIAAEKARDCQA